MDEEIQTTKNMVIELLEDMKAEAITTLCVDHLSDMMSYMIIATANSKRHCQATAQHLEESAKTQSIPILGIEGETQPDWILVDMGEIVVHIMVESIRDYYELEKLWSF
jgi:ribosome-associated protein